MAIDGKWARIGKSYLVLHTITQRRVGNVGRCGCSVRRVHFKYKWELLSGEVWRCRYIVYRVYFKYTRESCRVPSIEWVQVHKEELRAEKSSGRWRRGRRTLRAQHLRAGGGAARGLRARRGGDAALHAAVRRRARARAARAQRACGPRPVTHTRGNTPPITSAPVLTYLSRCFVNATLLPIELCLLFISPFLILLLHQ